MSAVAQSHLSVGTRRQYIAIRTDESLNSTADVACLVPGACTPDDCCVPCVDDPDAGPEWSEYVLLALAAAVLLGSLCCFWASTLEYRDDNGLLLCVGCGCLGLRSPVNAE